MLSIADRDAGRAPKRAPFFAIVAFVPLLLLAAGSFAAPITVPTSLAPGQQYRLAFVTAGSRDATSANIFDYDAFVQAEANTEASLSSISWQAIASTNSVDARDHTGTAPSEVNVPIFLLNDTQLSVGDNALWYGGAIDQHSVPLSIDQHGSDIGNWLVWTGTTDTGVAWGEKALGASPKPGAGNTSFTDSRWVIASGAHDATAQFSLYAISGILTVPEPTSVALLTLALVALLLLRMRRECFLVALLRRARAVVTLALLLLTSATALSAPLIVPTTLAPGAQYRLAFVTAGERDATSMNIADYDAFVTAEANTEAALSSISWRVIGSTFEVSARDHTETNPTNVWPDVPISGVPIYLLNDVKLADDYVDLWDGSVDTPLSITQHGELVDGGASNEVWTGTDPSGVLVPKRGLGQGNPIAGYSSLSTMQWVGGGQAAWNGYSSNLYALSEVLVVPVPEARPTALLTLGFAAILLARAQGRLR